MLRYLFLFALVAYASAAATVYADAGMSGGSVTTNSPYTAPASVLFTSGVASGGAAIINSGTKPYEISASGSGPAHIAVGGSFSSTCNYPAAGEIKLIRTDNGALIYSSPIYASQGTTSFGGIFLDYATSSAVYQLSASSSSTSCSITVSGAYMSLLIPNNV